MAKKRFEVKKKHLKLLRELYIGSYDEYGTPCVDSKRPFGNSDVTRDMLNILEIVDEKKYYELSDEKRQLLCEVCDLDKLFRELKTCLQILVANLSISEGVYEASEYGYDWKKVEEKNL